MPECPGRCYIILSDLIIGLEPLETTRHIHFLKNDGAAVYNSRPIGTIEVSIGAEKYPHDIDDLIKGMVKKAYSFDATEAAVSIGEKRAVNLVLLGAALSHIPLSEGAIREAISRAVPRRLLEINSKAFEAGRAFDK